MGNDENLYIIDFGLSKRYLHVVTGNHIPMCKRNHFVGTPRFISEAVQSNWEPCRRDDLISIGYVALMLLVGKLPWQSCRGAEQTSKCKRATTHEDLCQGLPDNFVKYFDYSCGLAHDDTPDYDYLKQLVRNSCVHEDIQKDVVPLVVQNGYSVQEKSRDQRRNEARKKGSPSKNSDAKALRYKATWDQISSATVKKIMYVKGRLPAMCPAQL